MSIRVGVLSDTDAPRNHFCRSCDRTFKTGEHFFELGLGRQVPITDRYQSLHVKCIRDTIDPLPLDEDRAKAQFDSLREKILVTGEAFPN